MKPLLTHHLFHELNELAYDNGYTSRLALCEAAYFGLLKGTKLDIKVKILQYLLRDES